MLPHHAQWYAYCVPFVTTKSEPFKSAFRVDPVALRRLVDLLEKEVLQQIELSKYRERVIEYDVKLSDGSNLSTTDLDEVLELENSRRRHITSIVLSTPYADSIRATVKLSNDSPPVSYDLRGEDKEVVSLSSKLDENLIGLRQWYSFVARYSVLGLLFLLYALAFVAAFTLSAADAFFPSLVPEGSGGSETSARDQFSFVLVVWSALLVGLTLDVFRKLLFPIATFAIGQGAKRDKTLAGIRVAAITVVLVPTLISAIFWYLGSSTP